MRGSYGAGTGLKTFKAVEKFICKVGVSFSGQGLGKEVGDLILGRDVAKGNVSCLYFLPEIMKILDQVI